MTEKTCERSWLLNGIQLAKYHCFRNSSFTFLSQSYLPGIYINSLSESTTNRNIVILQKNKKIPAERDKCYSTFFVFNYSLGFICGFNTALKSTDVHSVGRGEPANNPKSMGAHAEGTKWPRWICLVGRVLVLCQMEPCQHKASSVRVCNQKPPIRSTCDWLDVLKSVQSNTYIQAISGSLNIGQMLGPALRGSSVLHCQLSHTLPSSCFQITSSCDSARNGHHALNCKFMSRL